MPNYIISQGVNKIILRNFEGVITTYREPENYTPGCNCEVCRGEKTVKKVGVSGLLNDQQMSLEPEGLERKNRGKYNKHECCNIEIETA
jgi:lysine 2,3-aminomutase